MIEYLNGEIRKAKAERNELKEKIKTIKIERENCVELKGVLSKIGDNSSNAYYSLKIAGNALNEGIKIDGVGQGEKILERAEVISKLNSDAALGIENVEKRIKEIDENITSWNNRITKLNSSISGWQAQISIIQSQAANNTQS